MLRYYTKELRDANKKIPFDFTKLDKLLNVVVVLLFTDVSDLAMNVYVKASVDGIVTAELGEGYLNKINTSTVMKATSKVVVLCRASRVPTRRVILNDKADHEKIGSIVSDDLNPQKEIILLMLDLTQSKEKKT